MTEEEDVWSELASMEPAALDLVFTGVEFFQKSQHREALECFEAALVRAPNVVRLLIVAAEASCHIQRPDNALEHAQRAIELRPGSADACIALSWAYLQKGQFAEALSHAERAIELDQGKYFAWNNAGTALMYLGKFPDALGRFDGALRINPKSNEAIQNRNACLRRIENPDYTFFGGDFDIAEQALKAGQRVCAILDLANPAVNWKHLIHVTEKYPRLLVVDAIERSPDENAGFISALLKMGATRIAQDLMIATATRKGQP